MSTGSCSPAHAAVEWTLERPPYALETSAPGVFAVGDVRRGSVKRVASAVGEGSIAIQLLHDLFSADATTPIGRPTALDRTPAAIVTADRAPAAR